MKKVLLGLLALPVVVAMSACSANPGSSNEQASPSLRVSQSLSPSSVGPGQTVTGPDYRTLSTCRLYSAANGWFDANPRIVIKLPDANGVQYGMTDDKVPFPTPWISNQASGTPTWGGPGLNCDPRGPCLYEPDVYNYEHALLANVVGIVSHQFLVRDLPLDTSYKDFTHYKVGDQQFYYNGTAQADEVDDRNSVTMAWSGNGHVESKKVNCAYVWKEGTTPGTAVPTVYHAPVAESHDPVNWPN